MHHDGAGREVDQPLAARVGEHRGERRNPGQQRHDEAGPLHRDAYEGAGQRVPEPDRAAVVAYHPQAEDELAEGTPAGQRLHRGRVPDEYDHEDDTRDGLLQRGVVQRSEQRDAQIRDHEQPDVRHHLHDDVEQQGQYPRADPRQPDVKLDGLTADQPLGGAGGRRVPGGPGDGRDGRQGGRGYPGGHRGCGAQGGCGAHGHQ